MEDSSNLSTKITLMSYFGRMNQKAFREQITDSNLTMEAGEFGGSQSWIIVSQNLTTTQKNNIKDLFKGTAYIKFS